jgi:sec-independent protein translocase protein TatB
MFDFAWSEIALIGVVALVAIGPKDLPVAIKAVAEMIKKARRMAGEFQTHVDEMVREANLHEVREQFNDLRRMDIKGQILKAVDEDGSIRKTLSEPIDFTPPPPVVPVHDTAPPLPETTVPEHATYDVPAPQPEAPAILPPAFVPPGFVPPASVPAPRAEAAPPPPAPPAFVPPAAASAQTEHA